MAKAPTAQFYGQPETPGRKCRGRQCAARSKRTGLRCLAPAVTGSACCRLHGGRTPRGLASPHTKSGLYSKAMPRGLKERYEHILRTEDLGSLDDDIAAVTGELMELLGEERPDLKGLLDLWSIKTTMVRTKNDAESVSRKYMNKDEVWFLIRAILEAVRRNVVDQEIRNRIQDDLDRILASPKDADVISALEHRPPSPTPIVVGAEAVPVAEQVDELPPHPVEEP
jgi:hypothetical protein